MNGKPIRDVEQYGPNYAPTASPTSLRFQLAYSAVLNFFLIKYDCSNAFQSTYKPDPDKRIYCYLPPLYLRWYNYRYPCDRIDPTEGPYVVQSGQVIQGTPHAANCWYKNLHTRLTKNGY